MKHNINFDKGNGLIPVVVQDAASLQVLMLAYMNKDAFEKTLDTGKVTFFSRSRNALWVKGETSGNFMHLVDWFADCDNDTLLITVTPVGPACHRNTTTCFDEVAEDNTSTLHRPPTTSDVQFLTRLQNLLETRKAERPEGSYTTRLFEKGTDKIAQKVGEEAIETVIAAKNNNDELLYEASDLLFHLMVLLAEKGMRIEDLARELASRHKPG
jgi:phosphoribosyl-AMP cyclohydrolase / phosphoribosyl-ATP pyrophosphohydrolase